MATGIAMNIQSRDNNDFDLNMHTARLLMNEPFFSAVSRRINKRASYGIPTAGVMVNKETAQFEMLYNPEFFRGLKELERTAVLMHEFYHVIFKHVTDRAPWNKENSDITSYVWNISADLAINSHIRNLPEQGCIPGKGVFKDLPSGKAAEWYVPHVKKILEGQQNGGSGTGESGDGQGQPRGGEQGTDGDSSGSGGVSTLDDHSGWGAGDEQAKELNDIANERLKDIVKQASDEASAKGSWGSVSSSVKKDIIESLKTKVDWRKVLRFFVKSSQKANKSNTIRRINRRYPYIHAGRKSNRVANIAVSIDQSGSVDDQMLAMFFAELNKLSEVASFTVIPFDTRVEEDKVYEWRKGQSRKVERVLHGGTCFDAPTKYVNERAFDGHIVLTDMGAPKPISSRCQRMWMTTQQYADSRYFETRERVVVVD
jgi:predicted metal-dependent peptidase